MAKADQSTKAEYLHSRLYVIPYTHKMKNIAEVCLSKQASLPPKSEEVLFREKSLEKVHDN